MLELLKFYLIDNKTFLFELQTVGNKMKKTK